MEIAGVVTEVVSAVVVRIVGVIPVTGVSVPSDGVIAGVPGMPGVWTPGVAMVSWEVEQEVECVVGPGVSVVSVTLGGDD